MLRALCRACCFTTAGVVGCGATTPLELPSSVSTSAIAATRIDERPAAAHDFDAPVVAPARRNADLEGGAELAQAIDDSMAADEVPPVRRPTDVGRSRMLSASERLEAAHRDKDAIVRELVARAGLSWPPRQVLLRAFKLERRLEVWAADTPAGPLTHVTTYEVCAASGGLGPKRRQGDRQVPEGFYHVDWFHPKSDYHLALRVSYPNEADRQRAGAEHPGDSIMIHGACVSIGCLAMSDERIEELWLLTRAVKGPVEVHLFPTRAMDALVASHRGGPFEELWAELADGLHRFERTRRRFKVRVLASGRYELADL